ncbi:MAG: type II toxin-antitoxin system VapC family toxin [Hyphomicrobiales bacterium]|nr:type II toxin-antitoxin system VapC family toxin [Hyphomicrobiales bacterium]MBV9427131.1 type II toxin-antitoxin system VapC family toxin [Bradyrhizobiaceae bacterium]
MTRYLVDTNIVSVASPTVAIGHTEIIQWMDSHSRDLFLSAISVAEIAGGIAKLERQGAKRKAADLSVWLETVLHLYGDRVLVFDSATAQIAGMLSDLARGRGHSPGLADVIIAATARRHELIILSRNERHFAPMDMNVIDPFKQIPSDK